MSDVWQAIVVLDSEDTQRRLPDIEHAVLSFLWEKGIASREEVHETEGYPPGPNAAEYVVDAELQNWPACYLGSTIPHGVRVSRSEQLCWRGDGNRPHSLSCPNC